MGEKITAHGAQLRELMLATINLDLDELVGAGVIRDMEDMRAWHRWNHEPAMFVAKLDAVRLNALAALMHGKWPSVFGE